MLKKIAHWDLAYAKFISISSKISISLSSNTNLYPQTQIYILKIFRILLAHTKSLSSNANPYPPKISVSSLDTKIPILHALTQIPNLLARKKSLSSLHAKNPYPRAWKRSPIHRARIFSKKTQVQNTLYALPLQVSSFSLPKKVKVLRCSL